MVVLFDEAYWRAVMGFDALVEHGMIDAGDLQLFHFADSAEEILVDPGRAGAEAPVVTYRCGI